MPAHERFVQSNHDEFHNQRQRHFIVDIDVLPVATAVIGALAITATAEIGERWRMTSRKREAEKIAGHQTENKV